MKKDVKKINKKRWFCKKHGLEGVVGMDWCFGCYRIDEDTEQPVPYIGYPNANTNKQVIIKGPLPGQAVDAHLKIFGHLPDYECHPDIEECTHNVLCCHREVKSL